jgi:lysyl-tRNA synthetase class 2
MKRLLAAGAQQIFQIGKAFRAAEAGGLHNPEFTMLEWYDAAAGYEAGISFLEQLACAFSEVPNCLRLSYEEAWSDALGSIAAMPARESWRVARLGIRWPACISIEACGMTLPQVESLDHDGLLSVAWAELVEPRLGLEKPVVVFDWPAIQSALARTRSQSGREVAERFELCHRGSRVGQWLSRVG